MTVSRFDGPVQSVAGRDIHNHYHGAIAGPDPAVPGQAVRQCPQCLHITWAYNDKCHHCGLDVRVLHKRLICRFGRVLLGACLAVALVGLMYQGVQA